MPFWVKRILLQTGEIVTERELRSDENLFDGPAPVVGDELTVACRGRTFKAKVISGNWPGRNEARDPSVIVPLRVSELVDGVPSVEKWMNYRERTLRF